MTFTITQEHSFPDPPGRVFETLTNPNQLSRWFAEHVEVTPLVGGSYRFWGRHTLGTPSRAEATQSVTQYQPEDSIGFTWMLSGVPTEVNLRVRPTGSTGARLIVEHRVDGDLGVPRQKEMIDDHWRLATSNLAAYLAGGDGLHLPDFTERHPIITHTVRIDAPPSVVFRAMLEPERIARWLGGTDVVVEPYVGGRYELRWQYKIDGRDVIGGPRKILQLVTDELLVLDWPDWRGDEKVPDQRISFELLPNGLGGTALTFTHSGFQRVTDMGDYGVGWLAFLDQLRKEVMT